MNNVTLMGRMVRDAELRYATGAETTAVCSFTVAVKRPKSKDVTDFIECQAWGGTAEMIAKYFKKGEQVALEGTLIQNSWVSKNGDKRSKLLVNVRNFYFCGRSNRQQDDNSNGEATKALERLGERMSADATKAFEKFGERLGTGLYEGFETINDADVPF